MFFSSAEQVPILDQLRIEEALFRSDESSYCLAIHGSNPSIVMGAFGQINELVEFTKWNETPLPIIRRYSGGGTVVVDEETLFLCFILQKNDFNIDPYPKEIMEWVFERVRPLFRPYELLWIDNDFCLEVDQKIYKVAGNAQSISSGRIVHHISIPWSYKKEFMNLLKLPSKRPKYRQDRSHDDFLYPLNQTSLTPDLFIKRLQEEIEKMIPCQVVDYQSLKKALEKDHRKSTRLEKKPFDAINI